jgi:hypothetical protein
MHHVTRDQASRAFVQWSEYELVLHVEIFCHVIDFMEEQRVAIKVCVKSGKSVVKKSN